MQTAAGDIYRFGTFTLHRDRGQVLGEAGSIALRPKSFALLCHLVEHAGRLLTKDEIGRAVWPDVVVTDESIARCVSDVRRALGDEHQLLIKTMLGRGYLFAAEVEKVPVPAAGPSLAHTGSVLALPDKPSIAVLPFTNMSGDATQEYLADGITDEIITALSRFRSLFVIARNSTFAYKDRAVDVRTIGRDLGVRYVLAGSIRRADDRLRIIGQLIQADTGVHIWAERHDGDLTDIFDLQDKVASDVVGALAPQLERAEIERAGLKPTGSADAYDTYLRGMAKFYLWTMDSANEAQPFFHRAIDLDPGFAAAHAMAAHLNAHRKALGLMLDSATLVQTAELARRAVKLGGGDALVLSLAGWALAYAARDLAAGVGLVDRAILLNPNLAAARFAAGWLNVWQGRPDEAIVQLAYAMRLSPIDPAIVPSMIATAHAHFMAGRHDEALSWADKAMHEQRSLAAMRIAAASAASAGRLSEAKGFIGLMLQVDPTRRVSNVADTLGPYRRPEDLEHYKKALRLAGLPD